MNKNTSRWLSRFALAALLVAPAPMLSAAEMLRQNYSPGMSWDMEEKNQVQMDMTMDAMGQQMTMQQTIEVTLIATVEVLEANNGRPTKTKLTVSPKASGSMTMNMMGQNQNQPLLTATPGKTFVVLHAIDGSIELDPKQSQEVTDEVSEYFEFDPAMYPQQPVGPGDTWIAEPTPGPNGEKVKLTMTAQGVEMIGGRPAMKATFVGDIQSNMQGAQVEGKNSGTVYIDLATGLALQSNVDGTMKMSGTMQEQGMQIPMNGTGKVNSNSNTANVRDGNVAAAFDEVVVEGPMDDFILPQDVTGQYEGDGLKLIVAADWSVKIMMNGQTFEGRLSQQVNDDYDGVFSFQGTEFKFSLKTQGQNATFETSGKQYQLKKQGSGGGGGGNPLG